MQSLEEWLESSFASSMKTLTPLMRRVTTAWQLACRAEEVGDLTALGTALPQLSSLLEQIPLALTETSKQVTQYDWKTYLADQFDADFRKECSAAELSVEGSFPRYFVYPLRIQIESQRTGVIINGKRYPGLRVSQIVRALRAERTRLTSRPFNARYFLADLAAGYDDLIELETARNGVKMAGHEVSLHEIYRRLVPMRQWRIDYPETFFTFDLHRLLKTGEAHSPDARRLHLAPAREARRNYTVLDGAEREVQLGLLAFRND